MNQKASDIEEDKEFRFSVQHVLVAVFCCSIFVFISAPFFSSFSKNQWLKLAIFGVIPLALMITVLLFLSRFRLLQIKKAGILRFPYHCVELWKSRMGRWSLVIFFLIKLYSSCFLHMSRNLNFYLLGDVVLSMFDIAATSFLGILIVMDFTLTRMTEIRENGLVRNSVFIPWAEIESFKPFSSDSKLLVFKKKSEQGTFKTPMFDALRLNFINEKLTNKR